MFKVPFRTRSSVQSLFLTCGPSHVARLVVAVIVDTVNRVLRRWAPADVSKKRLVGMNPFVAYRDASATVIAVVLIVLVQAAVLHDLPTDVFWRDFPDSRISVGDYGDGCTPHALDRQLVSEATTAPRGSLGIEQRTSLNPAGIAAVAQAQPVGSLRFSSDSPSAKPLTSQFHRLMTGSAAATSRRLLGVEQGTGLNRLDRAAVTATQPATRLFRWSSYEPATETPAIQVSRSRSSHTQSIQ